MPTQHSALGTQHWLVSEEDLEDIAVGAGILGTGGGGNPYRGKLLARRHVRAGARVPIVPLDDVPDDALGVQVGGMGAPVIGIERIIRGDEAYMAMRTLEQRLGRRVTHVMPSEVGGGNSTIPIVVGALAGLPVVDGDGMGRAFPELQMTTFAIEGAPVSPAALCDYRHTTAVFDNLPDARTLERLGRAVAVAMGGAASFAFTPVSGAEMRRMAIPGTLSFARRLGGAVRAARRAHADAVAAACAAAGGLVLFQGKVVDVRRRLVAGFARGEVLIDGLLARRGRTLRIAFQNENLIAWERAMGERPSPGPSGHPLPHAGEGLRHLGVSQSARRRAQASEGSFSAQLGAQAPSTPLPRAGEGAERSEAGEGRPSAAPAEHVVATAPDLICIVDEVTAEPVTTEVIRFGLRVAVLGIPAPPLLRTDRALAVVGPAAFGYDVEYRPLPGTYGG